MSEHQQTHQSKSKESFTQRRTSSTKQTHISNPAAIIQRASIDPQSLTSSDVLQLQRTIGNRAVGMLLSEIRNPYKTQQTPVQRQEIPEEEEPLQGVFEKEAEETCPSCVQRQKLEEEEEPLQGVFDNKPEQSTRPLCSMVSIQPKEENRTGMPDNLKAGVESYSGIDMSDVRVHYNSDKPAEIGALAYTQGTNIHVAPGQERHLPHEAWHVVQQVQGRVQSTVQLKNGVPVNDDPRLEREADEMGARAVMKKGMPDIRPYLATRTDPKSSTMQRAAFDRPPNLYGVNNVRIDYDEAPADELVYSNPPTTKLGSKTTRLTALIPLIKNLDSIGCPTAKDYDPQGWKWIEQNETRSAKRQAIAYWVKFHLLNAELGGNGKSIAHLTPTDKAANSHWCTTIEENMKKKIKGAGDLTNPKGEPIFYDVKITYWNPVDAPGTYNLGPSSDYSNNITLFPKEIKATWATYKNNAWEDQNPETTGLISKPKGIGGYEVDLCSGLSNFSQLQSIYGIDEEIFSVLVSRATQKKPTRYYEVRAVLEKWLEEGASSPQSFTSRSNKLFMADSKLRQALTGNFPQKLKINNNFVPDDNTPEARLLRPITHDSDHRPIFNFESAPYKIKRKGGYEESFYFIREGYLNVSDNGKIIPDYREVISHAIRSALDPVFLSEFYRYWMDFIDPTKNSELPFMKNNHFAGENNFPEEYHVALVIFFETIGPFESKIKEYIGSPRTGQARVETDYLRELCISELRNVYWNELVDNTINSKSNLKKEHIREPKNMFDILKNNSYQFNFVLNEFNKRIILVREAMRLPERDLLKIFTSLKKLPWEISFIENKSDTMKIDLDTYKSLIQKRRHEEISQQQ